VKSVVPLAAIGVQPICRLPDKVKLNLAIGLPLQNTDALTNLLQQLYDPASPLYHRYLTPEQFTEQFGPSPADYQALIDFVQANGLTVTATYPNRALLDVTGAVADIEKAFGISLQVYQHPTENRAYFAPDTEPSLDLPGISVLSIAGLTDFNQPRPMSLNALDAGGASGSAPLTGSAPYGYYMGKDFRAAYAPGVTLTGAGQTVGLLQFDGYYLTDITNYEAQAGLSNVALTNVLLDGYDGTPGAAVSEVSLDIEMVVSMAPGLSQIVVYEAGPSGNGNDILTRMATDNLAKQLSASWTFGTDAYTSQIFQQFAAQGQSYFNASGDSDAYTGAIPSPADDPNVIVVGGTTLGTSGPGGAWTSEKVWNWNNNSGSGGGISTSHNIPSWQQALNMSANHGSATMRNIPDVAMTADAIWVIYGRGITAGFGGTSCATPLWAGFTALINQQATANAEPSVGFLNPALYALGRGANYSATFHDTTTGNNTNSASPANFPAVAGYDLATGWGTPKGQALINALAPVDKLVISPVIGFSAAGAAGGPFSVASQTFTLTNSGAAPLNWSLNNPAAWLNASAGGGTIPANSSIPLTLSLAPAASNLQSETYTATVSVTNQTGGVLHQLVFKLLVGDPLVLTPATGFASSGPAGGPFTVSAQNYSLTNLGTAALNWSLGGLPLWLNASSASGTIPAGSSITVNLGLNAAAAGLLPGNYAATVQFTNLTSGIVDSLQFSLPLSDPLVVSPASGFVANGPVGGPFDVTTKTLFLTNSGLAAVNWSLAGATAWLNASVGGGTLPSGSFTNVTFSLNASAAALPPGNYLANVGFSNLNLGTTQSRPFTLSVAELPVQNGGFETGNLSGWTQSGNTASTSVTTNAPFAHSGGFGALLGPYGSLGFLSQNLPTTAGHSYLFSAWLYVASNSVPNEFQVSWNGSVVFDQTNLTVAGWTNILVPVTSTSTNTALTLGFRNDPYYFGLDDVTVQALPTPVLQPLVRTGNSLTLTWSALPGLQYQVQYSTSLAQPNWTALGAPTIASGSTASASDTITTATPQRFYRAVLVP